MTHLSALAVQPATHDPQQIAAIKQWVGATFGLDDQTTILVTELRCSEPGCPPLETVIALLHANSPPQQYKLPKAIPDIYVQAQGVAGLELLIGDGPPDSPRWRCNIGSMAAPMARAKMACLCMRAKTGHNIVRFVYRLLPTRQPTTAML